MGVEKSTLCIFVLLLQTYLTPVTSQEFNEMLNRFLLVGKEFRLMKL
jgi:hypothetical protein